MQYPDLLNNIPYNLLDGVDQILPSNGKMYIRANANQVTVTFKEQNDPNSTYAILTVIPANTGQILDVVFPTKNSIIKVTGGTAYLKLYRD